MTRLSFPTLTFKDGRGDKLFEPASVVQREHRLELDEEPHTEAEKTLSSRLPGLILAQLCDADGDEGRLERIRWLQANLLAANRTIFGHGKDRVLAVLGASDDRVRLALLPDDRQKNLESLLLQLLGSPKYHPRGRIGKMEQLVEFVYQATENTFDHARLDFDGRRIRQVRFVSVERFQVGTGAGAVPIEKLAPVESSPLAQYLRRLELRTARTGGDASRMQLLSVTVADGGVGLAARMNNGFEAYGGDRHFEFKLVQEAVLPEGTTKPPGEPGRGAGLKKMMRACHRLDGLFEIRTGRLALHRTYLREDGTVQQQDFVGRDSSAFNLEGADDEVPMMAGTTTSLMFPNIDLFERPGSRLKGRG
ncbi:hypothetical protein [Geodermatophilus africanus]|nr:hypothetical protein [Geodermatophilus africanus]